MIWNNIREELGAEVGWVVVTPVAETAGNLMLLVE